MAVPLRVLIVEDSEPDCILVLRSLGKGGYEVASRRVDEESSMRTALADEAWDLVISDYNLPRFDAPRALRVLEESGRDIPFVVVSGAVGEESAAEIMRSGAHDFVRKDRLTRLVPVVERELREAAGRARGRQIQQQLILSDRMASVGTVAASIGHEINNPLAVALVNIELAGRMLASVTADETVAHRDRIVRAAESIRDAGEAGDRIRTIVRDLASFARPDEETVAKVDARAVMDSAIRMASNEIRHRAELERNYDDIPLVHVNEARLGQVFLNLLSNAAQAIPEGSSDHQRITVSTSTDSAGRAVIRVADTGCGIRREVLPRIFDPFFSTKPIGVGTGIGLAICRRLVVQMRGEIEVTSEVGRGSCFSVILPAQASPSLRPEPIPSVPEASRRGHVLVVDDEPQIGSTLEELLSTEHDVESVTSAGVALERIRAGARFDVVLCDLMMPVINGVEFYQALEAIDPDQAAKVVFATGGAFTPMARAFLQKVGTDPLDKPFSIPELRAVINRMVG